MRSVNSIIIQLRTFTGNIFLKFPAPFNMNAIGSIEPILEGYLTEIILQIQMKKICKFSPITNKITPEANFFCGNGSHFL